MSAEPLPAYLVYKNLQPTTKQKNRVKKRKILSNASLPVPPPKKIIQKKLPRLIKENREANHSTSPDLLVNFEKAKSPSLKKKKPKKISKQACEKIDEPPTLVELDSPPRSPLNDDPTIDALKLFKWIIEPLSPETFFNSYWEKKALHIKRSNQTYYTHILDSTALDKLLRNYPLYYTRNIDVVSYENGKKEVFNQEGRATPSALWDYYSNGCSIRILNPQTYNHKVHILLATLQEYFGTMVGANVYLTPPGSQGFAPHYDDIEAFVIQLEGRKHWKLYQPKENDVLARFSSPNLIREEIGDPFMTLTLEAGEVLYFPRGTIHEGHTDESAHSLHITVSVYQRTCYADLLEHLLPSALKRAAERDLRFRRGLPLNYLKNFGIGTVSDDRAEVVGKIKELIGSLVEYVDVDGAADQLGRKFMFDSMPPVPTKGEAERCAKRDGPYLKNGRVFNRVEIDLDTRIRLFRFYCIRLVQENSSPPKLYYNTENANVYHGEEEQWLELDPSMISSIKLLQTSYPRYIEVDQLPMEDVSVKMQLVSDLWERGLLITEYPLPMMDD